MALVIWGIAISMCVFLLSRYWPRGADASIEEGNRKFECTLVIVAITLIACLLNECLNYPSSDWKREMHRFLVGEPTRDGFEFFGYAFLFLMTPFLIGAFWFANWVTRSGWWATGDFHLCISPALATNVIHMVILKLTCETRSAPLVWIGQIVVLSLLWVVLTAVMAKSYDKQIGRGRAILAVPTLTTIIWALPMGSVTALAAWLIRM